MRIVYLAAGAAGSHCGACARDVTLVRELMSREHDVLMLPLYTPLATDGPDPSHDRIFYGGIGAYLAQKFSLFRRRLPVVDRLLDSPALLRAVSRFAVDTRPEDLGAMTVSVLQGKDGRQAKELEDLLAFLGASQAPEVVNLTNSLLAAIAPAVRARLGVPVVCTLQGEEAWVARLPEPYNEQARDLVRQHASSIDLFIAPHTAYAYEMADWLGVLRDRIAVVRPGVDTVAYHPAADRQAASATGAVRIGYLSRLAEEKGADLLLRALAEVESRRPGRVSLAVAGEFTAGQAWWDGVVAEFGPRMPAGRFVCHGALDFAAKVAYLQGLDVFVQPSRFAERRGMAALEAMACGAAVVAPRSGIFPELAESTGGVVLFEPEDVGALADALVGLVDDADRRRAMGAAARAGVEAHFSAERMATQTLAAYTAVTA